MGGERWAEILAFGGYGVSALLIAWGVVARSAVLVLLGLALSAIVIGVRAGTLVNWWAGEVATLLALLVIGALVVVLTRR